MGWMQKLYETYLNCADNSNIPDAKDLLPIAHTTQLAHIEIVIDGEGNFRRASLVQKEITIIPATEKSVGRTSGMAAHPLCDKIQYCAEDYEELGGAKKPYFSHVDFFPKEFKDLKLDPVALATAIANAIDLKLGRKTSTEAAIRWLNSDCCLKNAELPGLLKKESDNLLNKPSVIEDRICYTNRFLLENYFPQECPASLCYCLQLEHWCSSDYRHPKAQAVFAYIQKRSLVSDLIEVNILIASDGILVVNEKSSGKKRSKGTEEDVPAIFKLLTPIQDQGDALVRWRVETPGDLCTGTWEDNSLHMAWQKFEASQRRAKGFCMVTGDTEAVIAEQHPAKIRNGGDKAKLISSNDKSGFTYRGRFIEPDQVAGISFIVTQKAHNALRWLIGRKQAFKNGDQVIISWAVAGQPIPDPWGNSMDLFGDENANHVTTDDDPTGDVGQSFALRLNRAIAGYKTNLEDNADIVVMGLDSATPGRMAITFYRELKGSEFLHQIQKWHASIAWPQNYGKALQFVGAPAPRDIAEAAYGRRIDDKLRKATVERLLPCIIDGQKLPRDLVDSCFRRSCNRIGLEHWEWEKCLGIACAIFKGFYHERRYEMTLEENRKTRDYLFGRLLAVAEHIESRALYIAGEKRETMAARLMQRFADHPFSTWRTIELSLSPYKSRLRASRPGFLWEMEQLMDSLADSFSVCDDNECFTNDRPLTGEFLLGYHCQRQNLHTTREQTKSDKTLESSTN